MALKSMTGYGQAFVKDKGIALSVEIRSVNHRFFECVVRAPRELMMAEESVRQQVKALLARGRMDIYISLEETVSATRLEVNWDLLKELQSAAEVIQERISDTKPATVLDWLQYPGVVESGTVSTQTEALFEVTMQAVNEAAVHLLAMRQREGQRLQEDMLEKVREIEVLTASIEERAPAVMQRLEERLRSRLQEVVRQIDEDRIFTEIALLADKMTIDEELTRLRSHLTEFTASLNSTTPVGRRLDFIIQEMNREVNTIASKSQDVAISQTTVKLKAIIEQLREQVQNIE